MWFNPTFQGYNEREVERARMRSADDRMPKIVLVGQPSRAKRKGGRSRMMWEDPARTDLRELGTS